KRHSPAASAAVRPSSYQARQGWSARSSWLRPQRLANPRSTCRSHSRKSSPFVMMTSPQRRPMLPPGLIAVAIVTLANRPHRKRQNCKAEDNLPRRRQGFACYPERRERRVRRDRWKEVAVSPLEPAPALAAEDNASHPLHVGRPAARLVLDLACRIHLAWLVHDGQCLLLTCTPSRKAFRIFSSARRSVGKPQAARSSCRSAPGAPGSCGPSPGRQ